MTTQELNTYSEREAFYGNARARHPETCAIDEQQLRAADLLGKAQRAQKRGDELMQEFDELCANVEAYKKFFGVRLPKISRTSADKMRGEIEARAKRARKVQAAGRCQTRTGETESRSRSAGKVAGGRI